MTDTLYVHDTWTVGVTEELEVWLYVAVFVLAIWALAKVVEALT